MIPLFDGNDVLNVIKMLNIINIFQPVTKQGLIEHIDQEINGKQMDLILSELAEIGFVAREKGWYRVTRRGLSLNISRKVSRLRDIQRMEHLLSINKQRGGDSAGDDSSSIVKDTS